MKSLRVHSIVHLPAEGIGWIADWIRAGGHTHSETAVFSDPIFPSVDAFDMLIVMGGPMSVNDEATYAWLRPEKELIASAIGAGKAVVGICLGSQLIASALGSPVRANSRKEIGWFPIRTDRRVIPELEESMTVFHWHGETFDLPAQARAFAQSDACRNQGFLYGDRVLALQFHVEVTRPLLAQMISSGADELIPERYVQGAEQILAGAGNAPAANAILGKLLDRLAAVL